MDHLPPTSDILLNDTNFDGLLKECLAAKWFETCADVKQAVTSWITVVTDFLHAGTQALAPQWDRCLKING